VTPEKQPEDGLKKERGMLDETLPSYWVFVLVWEVSESKSGEFVLFGSLDRFV
jgi:hypothetical protein